MHRPYTFASTRLRHAAPMSRKQETGFLGQLYTGEPTAWAELVDSWSSPLYSYLVYNGVSEGEAQKLLQLIFAEVVQAMVGKVRVANLTILIFSVAHHQLLHYQGKNPDHALKKQRPSLPSETEANDQASTFLHRFQQCAPESQQILLLHYLCGISLPEIAQIVGQSEEFLKKTLAQAKCHRQ